VPEIPLTIADAAAALRAGELTAVQLTTELLARATAEFDRLGAFVTLTGETALTAAEAADADLAAGTDRGPLQGIPLAIKDIISTAEAPTTANSRILPPGWGGGIDAPSVARLKGAGAVILGKATTNEFALGMPDPDKGFPMPKNPWNLEHTAAGSSSGTGIAVAAGLALGGLGTDTGGSVRGPASANGHTGLKVTFGRVPKNGVVPLGYTHDSVGPMARSAWDCAALLEVIAGHDAGDPYASTVPVPAYTDALTGDLSGLKVGIPMPFFYDAEGVDPQQPEAALAAAEVLRQAGAQIVEVVIPMAREAKDANALSYTAEAVAYHRIDLAGRWETYGRYTRSSLARGALYSAADYAQAQRFRSWFRRQVAAVMAEVDVLLTPTSPAPAARIADMSPWAHALGPAFTGQWNFTGMPACAAPSGVSAGGLPLSLQVVGRPFAEATVLRVVDAYQRRTDWHLRVPARSAAAA
jgi:aspartyl-tRNA(Asn)/glutamyl-tRNA(Gln) amidotransferase subunit A